MIHVLHTTFGVNNVVCINNVVAYIPHFSEKTLPCRSPMVEATSYTIQKKL